MGLSPTYRRCRGEERPRRRGPNAYRCVALPARVARRRPEGRPVEEGRQPQSQRAAGERGVGSTLLLVLAWGAKRLLLLLLCPERQRKPAHTLCALSFPKL